LGFRGIDQGTSEGEGERLLRHLPCGVSGGDASRGDERPLEEPLSDGLAGRAQQEAVVLLSGVRGENVDDSVTKLGKGRRCTIKGEANRLRNLRVAALGHREDGL